MLPSINPTNRNTTLINQRIIVSATGAFIATAARPAKVVKPNKAPVPPALLAEPTNRPTRAPTSATIGRTKDKGLREIGVNTDIQLTPASHYQCQRFCHKPNKEQELRPEEWHPAQLPAPSSVSLKCDRRSGWK